MSYYPPAKSADSAKVVFDPPSYASIYPSAPFEIAPVEAAEFRTVVCKMCHTSNRFSLSISAPQVKCGMCGAINDMPVAEIPTRTNYFAAATVPGVFPAVRPSSISPSFPPPVPPSSFAVPHSTGLPHSAGTAAVSNFNIMCGACRATNNVPTSCAGAKMKCGVCGTINEVPRTAALPSAAVPPGFKPQRTGWNAFWSGAY